jgi:hypothetical protein
MSGLRSVVPWSMTPRAQGRSSTKRCIYVCVCDRRDSSDSRQLASRSTSDPRQVRERDVRGSWCVAEERLSVKRLSVPFCSPFQVRRQELYARDCLLQLPYTVSNQVLRDHDQERNIKLFMYIRPYHAHLDDTGNLARLCVRGHAAGVEEVLLATQPGICGPDVHIRHSDLVSRDQEHNSRCVEGREDGVGRRLRGRGHADRELLRVSVVCEQQRESTCK